jgi:hypothetical protein
MVLLTAWFKNFMYRKLHSIACHTPAANTVLALVAMTVLSGIEVCAVGTGKCLWPPAFACVRGLLSN